MQLEFNHKDINEFVSGSFKAKNNGKVFEAPDQLRDYLLKVETVVSGERVLVFREPLAPEEIESEEKSLSRMTKAELVVEADKRGIEVVPDSQTKAEIITQILEAPVKGEENADR
jgi:hypothetical protein